VRFARRLGFGGWAVVVVLVLAVAGCDDDDEADSRDAAKKPAEFGYSGAIGPANWASLDPAYAECSSGRRQSPIALTGGKPADLPRIGFSYRPAADLEAANTGHTVEVAYPEGSSIQLGGTDYALAQFHYHASSDHTLRGRSFPLEFHFVHKAADGSIAVLGVFARVGRANPAFSGLVRALPPREGGRRTVKGDVSPLDLLPANGADAPRWSYDGSLTTPPCTEGVRWNVFDRPIELSQEQIAAYTAVYDNNNRPVQPRNGRRLEVRAR
jgi:carbonic anhydrase